MPFKAQPIISITTIGALVASLLIQQLIKYVPEKYNLEFTILLAMCLIATIIYTFLPRIKNFFSFTSVTEHGIIKVHGPLDFKKMFEDVETRGEIKILDTYIPSSPLFLDAMADALKRDVKIKILAVKPDSEMANLRADEIGGEYDREAFNTGSRNYIKQITKKASTLGNEKNNLEMRYYSDLPCMPMYILKCVNKPSKMYFGFFLSKASVVGKHIEVIKNQEESMFDDFENYFDKKWMRNEKNKIAI